MRSNNWEEGQILLAKDATFEQVLHKGTLQNVGMSAMLKKDREAQRAATDTYFKHWDNKKAKDETEETRAVGFGSKFLLGGHV